MAAAIMQLTKSCLAAEVLVVGDKGTGKTTLIQALCPEMKVTNGYCFKRHEPFCKPGQPLEIGFWETAEDLQVMASDISLVWGCFDLTCGPTFAHLVKSISTIKEVNSTAAVMIAGVKKDELLENGGSLPRGVSREEVNQWLVQQGLDPHQHFFEANLLADYRAISKALFTRLIEDSQLTRPSYGQMETWSERAVLEPQALAPQALNHEKALDRLETSVGSLLLGAGFSGSTKHTLECVTELTAEFIQRLGMGLRRRMDSHDDRKALSLLNSVFCDAGIRGISGLQQFFEADRKYIRDPPADFSEYYTAPPPMPLDDGPTPSYPFSFNPVSSLPPPASTTESSSRKRKSAKQLGEKTKKKPKS